MGRVFASGQAYVALSRARSLQGLRVLDFDPTMVRCDSRVLHFYATLRQGRGLSLVRSHPKMVLPGVGRLRGGLAVNLYGLLSGGGGRKEVLVLRLWP